MATLNTTSTAKTRKVFAKDFYGEVKGEGALKGMPQHWLAVIEAENARNARIAAANADPNPYKAFEGDILWA